MTATLSFEHILTPRGIERHKRLVLDDEGRISGIEDRPGDSFDGWLALPGLPNAHSHCFQRAMTGHGERRLGDDSFWSWRSTMFALAARITPDDMYAIAARAFSDMLCGGFTSVAEFHYLHHLPDGRPGPEMAAAVVAAAAAVGIRLVMLPVLYQCGGFGQPADAGQSRFLHARIEDFIDLLRNLEGVPRGIAIHSLRAVQPESIAAAAEAADTVLGGRCPKHIHVAEQLGEVDACRAAYGAGPIDVLGRYVELDDDWHLVHATHASERELDLMTCADVTVVLCPLTEAYLGDGLFPAREFVTGGGRIAVGSDCNVRIDAVEELRLLEYGQRLRHHGRACLATEAGLGGPLWTRVGLGGGAALGLPIGRLECGDWADLVVVERSDPIAVGLSPAATLDALITAGSAASFSRIFVGGRCLVTQGQHRDETAIDRSYRQTMARLALT